MFSSRYTKQSPPLSILTLITSYILNLRGTAIGLPCGTAIGVSYAFISNVEIGIPIDKRQIKEYVLFT